MIQSALYKPLADPKGVILNIYRYGDLGDEHLFLLRPILIRIYIRWHYKIDWNLQYDKDPVEQKWYDVAQHIAAIVLDSTDMVVLSIFSTASDVAVYSVISAGWRCNQKSVYALDAVAVVFVLFVIGDMSNPDATWLGWIVLAVKESILIALCILAVNVVFYYREAMQKLRSILQKCCGRC